MSPPRVPPVAGGADDAPIVRRLPPSAPPVLAFGAGVLLPVPLPTLGEERGVIILLALALVLLACRGRLRASARRLVVAGLIPASLGLLAAPAPPAPPPRLPEGPLAIHGTVRGSPRPELAPRDGGQRIRTRFRLSLINVGGASARGTILAIIDGDPPLGRGDGVSLEGRSVGPGVVRVGPTSLRVVERAPIGWLDRARHALRRSLDRTLSRRGSAWGAALLLGDRGRLPPATRELFRSIGQGHILAISGLHVGMVYAALRMLGRRTRRSRGRAGGVTCALAIVAYSGVAGADPPVLRAACFAAVALLATRRGLRPRLPELWLLSFLLLAAGTDAGHAVGFWLSFAAVAGIALVVDRSGPPRLPDPDARFGTRGARVRRVGNGLRIATAAWLGAHVVLVHVTPDVVPFGPLISLLAAPWLALVLATTAASLVPGVAAIAAPLQEGTVRVGEAVARAIDLLPMTPATLPAIPPVVLSLLACSLLALLARTPRSATGFAGLALLLLVLSPTERTPQLIVPDLARGQSIIVLGHETTLLLDAGSIDRRAGGADAIRKTLWIGGRSRIDAIVLSHAHADHVLAVPGLVARHPVGRVFVGPRFDRSPLGAAILRSIRASGVPVVRVAAGDRFRLGEFVVFVHHPPRAIPPDLVPAENDDSLVVTVEASGSTVLAPGDLEGPGIAGLQRPPPAHVIVLPHHGKHAAGLASWIRAIAPRHAIASTEDLDPRVRSLLERAGIPVAYPTRERGATVLPLLPP